MSREVMKLALDMLNEIADDVYCDQKLEGVITALRQALVNADDTSQKRVDEMVKTEHDKQIEIAQAYERGWNAALAQQEPVAWRFRSGTWFNREVQWRYIDTLDGAEGLRGLQPLYTAPPKREWVGLTDEDMEALFLNEDGVRFARYIESRLKDKNA